MFNKATFDAYARLYGDYLQAKSPPLPYWYQAQREFQINWDPANLNTGAMVDKSIDESTDKWSSPINEAKQVLMAFSEINADLLLAMFRDLFDEKKALDGRMDRFLFHLDLLLSEINQKKIKFPDHHHNKRIVSVYLSYYYPELYLPFEFDLFHKAMQNLRALKIPESYEIERYYKICRIMTRFLLQNENVSSYFNSLKVIMPNQLLAYDFMQFCAQSKV